MILAEKLKGLKVKASSDEKTKKRDPDEKIKKRDEGGSRSNINKNSVILEGSRYSGLVANTMWVNAGECVPQCLSGKLKYCVIGWWKTPLNPFLTAKEIKEWVIQGEGGVEA